MEKVKLKNIDLNEDLESFKESCYKEIINNKEFYSLISEEFSNEEINKNISKFFRYLKDYEIVKTLKTYEDCKKNNKYFYYSVSKKNNILIEKEKEVPAYHDYIYYVNHFLYSDFDYDSYYKLDLKSIPRKELVKQIRDRAKANVSLFYIYGANNTFKTLSAIAMCNGYIKNKNYKIAFINSFKRFKELNDLSFNKFKKEEYDEMFNNLINVKVLVIDGFGDEYKNSYLRDSIVIPLLKERFKKKDLITIITSNSSIEEISNLYKLKDSTEYQSRILKELLQNNSKLEIYSGSFSI